MLISVNIEDIEDKEDKEGHLCLLCLFYLLNFVTMSITKAVVPVAGYATRFLPFAKSVPKQMLPIIDTPVIQIIVEQLVEAGIKVIIIVTGAEKRAIEDYFDYNYELECALEKKGKLAEKEQIRKISDMARFIYVRQREVLGNGHAVLQAKEAVGDEPFAVAWGDDFLIAEPNRYTQLIKAFSQCGGHSISEGVKKDLADDYNKYGYLQYRQTNGGLRQLEGMVEKPGSKENSPSDLANLGGFIFTPKIFEYLEKQKPGKGGEIYLSETVCQFCKNEPMFVQEISNAHYYDCGSKSTYLEAIVDFALKREDTRDRFREYLKQVIS